MDYKKTLDEYYTDMVNFYNSINTFKTSRTYYLNSFINYTSDRYSPYCEITKSLVDEWLFTVSVSKNTRNSIIGAL